MSDITTNKKAAGAINTNGLHTYTNGINFRTDAAINQANDGNAIATRLKCLASAGHVIHKVSAGDFTVCKSGMTRYSNDFDRRLGVK